MQLAAALLLYLLHVLTVGQAASQTFHVISVSASKDVTIGKGSAANAAKIRDYVKAAARAASMSLKLVEIDDVRLKFSCAEVKKQIEALRPGADDVVLFYYSGHGFAPQRAATAPFKDEQSIFPWLYCDETGPHPGLEEISKVLAAKRPRLTIAVSDACNVVLPIAEEPFFERGVIDQKTRALLRDYKGTVLVSSSKRGEYSWYLESGGAFTTKFMQVLRNLPSTPPGKLWNVVIEKSTQEIVVQSEREQPQAAVVGLSHTGRR